MSQPVTHYCNSSNSLINHQPHLEDVGDDLHRYLQQHDATVVIWIRSPFLSSPSFHSLGDTFVRQNFTTHSSTHSTTHSGSIDQQSLPLCHTVHTHPRGAPWATDVVAAAGKAWRAADHHPSSAPCKPCTRPPAPSSQSRVCRALWGASSILRAFWCLLVIIDILFPLDF
jgi:hypothetical protein